MTMTQQAPKKPGRPRNFERDAIVEASVDVFWRHGASGTTTRVLESELGVSQSSLYNTYGSKAELLDQTLAHYDAKLDAAVLAKLAEPSQEAIVGFIDALVLWVGDTQHPGCLVMNLAMEDPEHAYRLQAYRTKLRRAIKPCVQTFTAEETDVDTRTELLLAAVLGLTLSAKSGLSAAELQRLGNGIRSQVLAW